MSSQQSCYNKLELVRSDVQLVVRYVEYDCGDLAAVGEDVSVSNLLAVRLLLSGSDILQTAFVLSMVLVINSDVYAIPIHTYGSCSATAGRSSAIGYSTLALVLNTGDCNRSCLISKDGGVSSLGYILAVQLVANSRTLLKQVGSSYVSAIDFLVNGGIGGAVPDVVSDYISVIGTDLGGVSVLKQVAIQSIILYFICAW